MDVAGYAADEAEQVKREVKHYENVRGEVKLASGDAIDLKRYEPAMRHLIDTYIRAEESVTVSELDDLSLVQLIVERGVEGLKKASKTLKMKEKTAAETIDNNVRRLIIDQTLIN